MGEVVIPNAIKREYGYLYYVNMNGDICRAKIGKKKKKEVEE